MYNRDQLLAAVDLSTLADEMLGSHHGSSHSPTWPCPNPRHAQTGRTPPVTIFQGRAGFERWHCHGCGAGGTAIDLVMTAKNVGVKEAIGSLATRGGVSDERGASRLSGRRPTPPRADRITDPQGLADFVDSCARRLWTPEGAPVLRWLTDTRRLPEAVLRKNAIGADPGNPRQPRPDGMPSAGWAAVLPVIDAGCPVYAQLRVLGSGRRRYLNPTSGLAPNPRLGGFEPVDLRGCCILLTEGIIDALSASAAGYRSAALLGAAVPEQAEASVGGRLQRGLDALDGRIVLALDADDAGRRAANRLAEVLEPGHQGTVRLHLPRGRNDLNDWLRSADDWPQELEGSVRASMAAGTSRGVSR